MKSKLIGILIVLNLIVVTLLGMVMITVPGDVENVNDEINTLPMKTFAPMGISNVNDLQNMNLSLAGDYYLNNDIDATATSTWNGGKGFDPVGDGKGYFNGSFDGRGFNITGLYIDLTENFVGLFGLVGPNVQIKNVSLINVNITGSADATGTVAGWSKGSSFDDLWADGVVRGGNRYTGGLVGRFWPAGYINNSHTDVNVTSSGTELGGLVGDNYADIFNSSAVGNVIGSLSNSYYVGGIAGYSDGNMNYVYADSIVKGNQYIGGLIGEGYGIINNSYTKGLVQADGGEVGGLVGISDTEVNNSYSTATVISGGNYAGGLLGDDGGSVTNSYSTGSVTGTGDIGGLLGFSSSDVTNCYSTSDVNGSGANVGGLIGRTSSFGLTNNSYAVGNVTGGSNVGGLIGNNNGQTYEGLYFDNITSGTTTAVGLGSSVGATGKNTTMMKKQSTFTPSAWDFVNIWGIKEDETYPYLQVFFYPPSVLTTSIPSALEDQPYAVTIDFDYSGSGIVINFTFNTDSWLVFDNVDTFTGTPTNSDVGTYWINATISDDKGNSDTKNFTVEVVNVNDPPEITTVNKAIAYDGKHYSVDYDANDIDPTSDTLTWNLTPAVGWLNFNNVTGLMTGTPTNADTGAINVTVRVDDGNGGNDTTQFTLTVVNVNDPPVIKTADDTSATEGVLYSVDYDADDLDPTSDVMHWSLITDAAWLSIDNNTGLLSGTPGPGDIGDWKITVMVEDGKGGFDISTFTITVAFINDAPELVDITLPETTPEDVYFSLVFSATDADLPNDELTWNMDTDAAWLSFDDSTGMLYGTPTNADVGSYWIKINVTDLGGENDTVNFNLAVINVNDPPVISTTPTTTATEELLYEQQFAAADIDPGPDTLSWTLDSGPSWLQIDSSSGILNGTPSNSDVGKDLVTITVSDGNGGSDSLSYKLEVINVNDPPVWVSTPDDLNVTEGLKLGLSAIATDEDAGDSIAYGISSTPTSGISVNEDTGVITWAEPSTGSYVINITASDGTETIWHKFTLKVIEKGIIEPVDNNAPVLDPIDDQNATVDVMFKLMVSGSDTDTGDTDKLVFSLKTAPSGMVISKDGQIVWVPEKAQVGEHTVTVGLTDGRDDTSASFNITVKDKPPVTPPDDDNNPPTIDPVTKTQDAKAGDAFELKITGSDPDEGDKVSFELEGEPDGMVISNNGEIIWLPDSSQVGEHTVTVIASDGVNETEVSFTVTVTKEDEPTTPDDKDDKKEEAKGLESPAVSIPLGLIIGLIIGIIVGMMMRARKKPEKSEEAEEEFEEE